MNATQATTVFPGTAGTITTDARLYRGVMLDKLETVGPKGGKQTLWRAANKRKYQVASWSWTMADAAK